MKPNVALGKCISLSSKIAIYNILEVITTLILTQTHTHTHYFKIAVYSCTTKGNDWQIASDDLKKTNEMIEGKGGSGNRDWQR